MRRSFATLTVLVLVFWTAAPLRAQFGPSLRGSGLAGAYASLALGHETIDWNPALLGINTSPLLSIGLPRVNLAATTTGPSWFELRKILRKRTSLDDVGRADFIETIASDGLELGGDLQLPWLGLSIGPVALSVSTTALARGNADPSFLDLLLYTRQYGGVDPMKLTEYEVGNTSGRGSTYTTFKLGYGRSLGHTPFPVSVGVTGRYIVGHHLGRTRVYEPRVDPNHQDISVPVHVVSAPGGKGYGLDLGIAARPFPSLKIGVSIDNVVHSMDWTEDLEYRHREFRSNELGALELGDLRDQLEPRPFDPDAAPPEARELADGIHTRAHAPRVIRAGASYELGGTALGATISTTQGDGDLHAGWPTYLAVGAEQKVPILRILALRGGYAISFSGANALAGGASLKLGSLHIAGAVIRTTGHDDPSNTSLPPAQFADRLSAGSGYSASLGIELLRF